MLQQRLARSLVTAGQTLKMVPPPSADVRIDIAQAAGCCGGNASAQQQQRSVAEVAQAGMEMTG
jgi:hypothetical protein